MNVLYILSDQHNPEFAGCYGHPLAETPALDALAARGTRFTRAYCSSPLCVPSRASMFSGKYVHEIGAWDNAFPWPARAPGWPAHFQRHGVKLTTVGKLDFQPGADHGIEEPLLAVHRKSRDIHGLYRHEANLPPRWSKFQQMEQSGPREGMTFESFKDYPRGTRAIEWLRNERPKDRPWILNLNYSMPHPGWPCPPDLWAKWEARVKLSDLPEKYFEAYEKLHPYHKSFAHHQCGRYADDERLRRGYAAYLAHCEMIDRGVARALRALEETGEADETLVVYASDHGESCRAHRMWGKMNMYEDSIRVPLLMAGPGLRKGAVVDAPVSLLDLFPTFADVTGAPPAEGLRGISLLGLCRGDAGAPRHACVLSEFHGNGFPGGVFAVVDGRWKYVACAGERSMLFDLRNDPQELDDLAAGGVEAIAAPEARAAAARLDAWLRGLLDPEEVDARAKADQAALRRAMDADGTLAHEVYERGYERRGDRLVPRPETVQEGFEPMGLPL